MTPRRDSEITALNWVVGGGEMGALVRSMDWSQTLLGPLGSWPQSLRTTVNICLASDLPICIIWGPGVQIYNDGYRVICGGKHPKSMGQNFSECWAEAWPVIGEAYESALAGDTAFLEDQHIFLGRHGYNEECFFTFSFSPIRSEDGHIGGLFHPVIEMTSKVLGERRTRTLSDLAVIAGKAESIEEALFLSIQTLAPYSLDLPFALTYQLDKTHQQGHLIAATGLVASSAVCAPVVDLCGPNESSWPLGEAALSGLALQVDDLQQRFGEFCCSAYPEVMQSAMLLPITPPGLDRPTAVLVLGISPRMPMDEMYRGFYAMLASAVTSVVASARAYEEERKRAEALAALDRAKTDFFSNVSHEFRTPLTLLLGPTEELLAMQHGVLPDEAHAQIGIVHRNALRLQKLVNALLDFSRVEAGRAQASYQATDLAVLSSELASVFRSAVEKAGLQLVVDCPRLTEPIFVDREMWEKIVLNLISNAFKFTFEGAITVAMQDAGAAVQLCVRDTGAGIASENLSHIFERFHRVEAVRARTHEGTGIGLALVQELVRLHGGTVAVRSVLGEGSTFIVTIPKGSSHLPIDHLGPVDVDVPNVLPADHYAQEALHWLSADDGERAQRGAPYLVPGSPLTRQRILLADDNADMRNYVARLLGEHYAVQAVSDGVDALNAARCDPPDLILADVMMPRLDGFGLLRQLRADPATSSVPVILLSARAGEQSRIHGIEMGADDYMVKPFHARELLARVGAQLQMTRVRLEANLSLRESEARLHAFVMASSDVIYRMSPDWSEMRELNGRDFIADTKEPLRDWIQEYIQSDDQPQVLEAINLAIRTKNPFALEHRVRRLNGTLGWASSRAIPLLDAKGDIFEWFGTASDITSRKEAEEASRLTAIELADADRRKNEFLAMLAHELRNPLAPISNALQVIRRAEGSNAAVQSASAIMERQIGQMVRLVDDLLDVSRISRGNIALRKEHVELASVVQHAVETIQPFCELMGHELTIALPHQPAYLSADPTRLAQIIGNLLHNACKFTDKGGRIALMVEGEGDAAVIRVRDSGIGIAAEQFPDIFELFNQIDTALERSRGGLGIGLTLVKRLVEMHGGTVQVSSAGINQGSEFVVRLPLLVDVPEQALPEQVSAVPAPGQRILVVDDNRDSATSLAELLQYDGYQTNIACDGLEAVQLAERFRPEVVLLDIGLPKINGYEAARKIRQEAWGKDMVLVALTGWGQDEDRRKSREAGFDAHLVKPVDIVMLMKLLAQTRS